MSYKEVTVIGAAEFCCVRAVFQSNSVHLFACFFCCTCYGPKCLKRTQHNLYHNTSAEKSTLIIAFYTGAVGQLHLGTNITSYTIVMIKNTQCLWCNSLTQHKETCHHMTRATCNSLQVTSCLKSIKRQSKTAKKRLTKTAWKGHKTDSQHASVTLLEFLVILSPAHRLCHDDVLSVGKHFFELIFSHRFVDVLHVQQRFSPSLCTHSQHRSLTLFSAIILFSSFSNFTNEVGWPRFNCTFDAIRLHVALEKSFVLLNSWH